jgi:hypothetical protein
LAGTGRALSAFSGLEATACIAVQSGTTPNTLTFANRFSSSSAACNAIAIDRSRIAMLVSVAGNPLPSRRFLARSRHQLSMMTCLISRSSGRRLGESGLGKKQVAPISTSHRVCKKGWSRNSAIIPS